MYRDTYFFKYFMGPQNISFEKKGILYSPKFLVRFVQKGGFCTGTNWHRDWDGWQGSSCPAFGSSAKQNRWDISWKIR